ncbi:MAG: hypothetical protein H8E14_13485 [Candidatus Marinimicrobia bacterium]|nr:hypothetical protein [Candidatus Neomarinimicrobiota bacterium]
MSDQAAREVRRLSLRVIASEEVTVVTAGTPVNPSSNTDAVAVRVINNNAGALVACGLQAAQVDALSSPPKGSILFYGGSDDFYVSANANEVEIDADTNGTVVTVQLLGR